MKFVEQEKNRVIAVDLDGTLTNGEPFWDGIPTPNKAIVEQVRELYQQGNIIIIWTARAWELAPETVGWLVMNRIPYHGLYMAKGGADLYIDDKCINTIDFIRVPEGNRAVLPLLPDKDDSDEVSV